MARAQLGGGVTGLVGSQAGNTWFNSSSGTALRARVTPINPNTSAQSAARALLATLAKRWGTVLTDPQRTSWSAFGKTMGSTGAFGNRINLSGISVYIRLNKLILQAGGSMIDTPPVNLAVSSLTTGSLVANHTGPLLTLTFTPTPYAANTGLYIFATPALSPGITNVKNRLRFLTYSAAAASPLELHTQWIAKFGSFPAAAGQRIALSVQGFSLLLGAITPPTIFSTIVS